ncbi:MAG: beta-ketoacyl synthase N-terminal-like domain-containing protein [Polyangiales bacterium]
MLSGATTSVIVGMGCDAEIARFGARWRATSWGQALGASPAWSRATADAFVAPLEAAGVVGTMPNIPANRINSALDARGPSFTVSAEEASGLVALEIAAHALVHREIDAAVVAAVDLSCEPIHREAVAAIVGRARAEASSDAAVALVLKRLDDAIADGEEIVAIVAPSSDTTASQRWQLDEAHDGLTAVAGHAHAASGLLLVAAAALGLQHRARSPVAGRSIESPAPWLPGRRARVANVEVKSRHDVARSVALADSSAISARPMLLRASPRIALFTGVDRDDVIQSLALRREGGDGPARLTIVARDDRELDQRVAHAVARLADPNARGVIAPGCVFHSRPVLGDGGELAFVFTGAASAYRGMGRSLALAFPDAVARLEKRFGQIEEAAGWIYRAGGADETREVSPVDKLWGTSFLSQLHAEILQHVLGVRPHAAIGVSSGETNALFALGAFTDMDVMHADVDASGLYTTALGGDFGSVRRAWGLPAGAPVAWENHRIVAPVSDVRRAIESVGEGRVHVTIVQASDDCVIGGDAAGCRRVIDRVVGREGADRARSIGYDLAIHCTEVEAWRDEWWKLHRRDITLVEGVRFYAHAFGTHYALSSDRVADALTGQAVRELDFPTLIEGAHGDGVRMFVELGPQSGCSRWIEQALGRDRPFATVSLDFLGEDSIDRLVHAAAHLIAAGVEVDHATLARRLELPKPTPTNARALRFPAHWSTPEVPRVDATTKSPPKSEPAVTTPASTSAQSNGAKRNGHHAKRMLPAPALVAVTATRPAPMRGEATPRAMDHAPAHLQAHEPSRMSVVESPSQHAIAEVHRRVSAMHREFMEQQTRLHARFLGTRAAGARGPAVTTTTATATRAAPISAQTSPPQPPSPAQPHASDLRVRGGSESETSKRVDSPPLTRPAVQSIARERRSGGGVFASKGSEGEVCVPRGPAYSRADLEVLAGGKISRILGPLFAQQDDFRRQVRMPMAPLLLADRVLGIDAEPGVVGKGTLWTETDVTWDSWYLHDGRIPAGVMIEAGQADLLLISWMGADFLNKGERVYRLLGCELTYHVDPTRGGTEGLPRPGQTLRYDIHVDGHANLGDVRIFFFHYDCRVHPTLDIGSPESGVPVLSVRRGQAGFFTDEELAGSGGILWTPEDGENAADPRLDPPRVATVRRSFSRAQIEAFTQGRVRECFGDTHAIAETHVRTPRIGRGRLDFLGEVTELDPSGGPWKRGYLRAVSKVTPADWFFEGHFKDDPCMPGTLMFEACQQAMAFYLAALGHTLDKDGWRFEPVPEETYKLLCRGQVTPSAKELVYEVFVDELIDDPITGRAAIFADILCTVDGLKAFHCRRMGIHLTPDFPSSSVKALALAPRDPHPCATVLEPDGHTRFAFDLKSLIACAWGKPSEAFGQRFALFDGHRRTPRLPGPPYHFMSRITRVDGDLFEIKAGAQIEVEYDLPADAWYFEQTSANGHAGSMPYCVILEAALQPCGWLASATGVTLSEANDVAFRNLDGHSTWHRELRPGDGPLVTRSKLTSLSRAAGMIIVGFEVFSFLRDGEREAPVFTMKTVFGFFPKEALASQAGLSTTAADRVWLEAPSNVAIDLKNEPPRFFSDVPRMTPGMLRLLDRITGDWPSEANDGTGRVRAEKDIAQSEWFFKAHFFQDPVQPGSLGIEAMIEIVQAWVKLRDLAAHLDGARFEPLAIGGVGAELGKATWKYRGQVLPHNKVVTTEAEITKVITTEESVTVVANVWLWVDGMRIYSCHGLAVRAVGMAKKLAPPVETRGTEAMKPAEHGGLAQSNAPDFSRGSAEPRRSSAPRDSVEASPHGRAGPDLSKGSKLDSEHEFSIDPASSPWVLDHCPTYTVPALPFTSLADLMASAVRALAPELRIARLRDVRVHRWVTFPPHARSDGSIGYGPARLKTVTTPGAQGEVGVELLVWREAKDAKLSRFEVAASAKVRLARAFEPPIALAKVDAAEAAPSPYSAGMFHGPAFQRVRALKRGASSSVATIDASTGTSPKDVPIGAIAPLVLDAALHGIPHDELWRWCADLDRDLVGYPLEVEALTLHAPTPTRVLVQVAQDGRVWADLALVEVLLPKGPLGRLSAHDRRRFLADRAFVEGAMLTVSTDGESRVRDGDVRGSDWLPGTLATAYRLDRQPASLDATTKIAIADHVAHLVHAHPSTVTIDADGRSATTFSEPITRRAIDWRREGDTVVVRSGPVSTDITRVRKHWAKALGVDRWLVGDLYFGLLERFVRRVVVHDPAGIEAISGRGAIFVANHQVGVESLLFSITASSLVGGAVATLAKDEHRRTWIGQLIALGERYPGVTVPESIVFFDRKDEASLLDIAKRLGAMLKSGGSLMVHVEGTRALAARQPVQKMASLWIDLAISTGAPLVPVRFGGGLPVEPLAARLDFPVGYGAQEFHVGAPIDGKRLASMTLVERTRTVVDAINTVGGALEREQPCTPNATLASAVESAMRRGLSEDRAVLLRTLEQARAPSEETSIALSAILGQKTPKLPDDAKGRWLGEAIAWLGGATKA